MRRLLWDFLVCLVLIGCQKRISPVEDTRFLMDTLVRISVYSADRNSQSVSEAINRAFDHMADIESRVSSHSDSSETAHIIRQAGKGPVQVSPDALYLITESMKVSRVTEGLFDPTIGAVKTLWGFDTEHPGVPLSSDLKSTLKLVDFSQIQLKDNTVLLKQPRMRIDLGGVAKGYIIDKAVETLIHSGINAGIIDAGGDLRIFGTHPKRKTWRIAIRHPRSDTMDFLAVLETEEASVATSGDYERYFIQSGERYHHILDPRTGYPVQKCVSVTIVTDNALEADAYATAVFVMGPDKGMAFIEATPAIEGLIVFEKEGQLESLVSTGLKERIQFQ